MSGRMFDRKQLVQRLRSAPALAAVVVALVLGVFAAGSYYAYEAYDYVQHDNDFCMSCHLMQDPYEQFAESAHRGLGCKACHQPNLMERSQMAMTQVIENPDEISVHAEVPNERCVSCHVEGDPERWRSIAQSAGHRTHMESEDSALVDISCVECHSTSVHQFAPVDETCAQSGCHTDNSVSLGNMSDLTIHCVACHSFSAPVDPVTTAVLASQALSPTGSECLSCHVMRTIAEMPENDPHEQQCASCHNPHEQDEPEDAVASCAIGGCHDAADALTPFHQGLHQEALDDCTSCHSAHDFSLSGDNCLNCHTDIFEGPGTNFDTGRRSSAALEPAASTPSVATLATHGSAVASHPSTVRAFSAPIEDDVPSGGPSAGPVVGPAMVATEAPGESIAESVRHDVVVPDTVTFRHDEHRDVDCMSCHSTDESHGALSVTTIADCRSCHHSPPESEECTTCHADSGAFAPGSDLSRTHTMAFEVKPAANRELPFDHEAHESESCTSCHEDVDGGTLPASGVSCSSCHTEHHDATAQVECRSCHVPAPLEKHPVSEVHVTCSGSGCHAESTLDDVPRVRELCLTCHQDMVDHKQEDGRTCAGCHTLPPPRNSGG